MTRPRPRKNQPPPTPPGERLLAFIREQPNDRFPTDTLEKMSLQQAGRRLGCTRAWMQQLVSGKARPSRDLSIAILTWMRETGAKDPIAPEDWAQPLRAIPALDVPLAATHRVRRTHRRCGEDRVTDYDGARGMGRCVRCGLVRPVSGEATVLEEAGAVA